MSKTSGKNSRGQLPRTLLIHTGRDPGSQHGFVNTPIYRGSTVLFPSVERLQARDAEYTYGRRGTPTLRALETAISELEHGDATVLTPSGLSAIACAFLAFAKAGDHILVSDSVYQPTRKLCDNLLKRMGVTTSFYDPRIGAEIESLFTAKTRLVYCESPGSQTFEMQDIPAIAERAHQRGIMVVADNTWATPLYCNPLELGADAVIHAGTKYFCGHADANLGSITVRKAYANDLRMSHGDMGICAGPEDTFLCLRGLRSLSVRLEQHRRNAIEMAEWIAARAEVVRVLHPAFASHEGHDLWKRDFSGSTGLFSVILRAHPAKAIGAMLDSLELFGMGYSWGGYESLVIPFDPSGYRSATKWEAEGPALRFHIGLEDTADLKADLERGFEALGRGH
ncbi:MAG: cystathionine beta-lyase [Pseudomonadota bacterium]|nr:cystathionine beta-lyase [Pseudomonadota bacterium]